MTYITTLGRATGSLWTRGGARGQLLIALATGAALALISWQAGILDTTGVFGGVAGDAASSNNPGAFVAIGAALVIGATMIVLPCGFPAVFAVPSILSAREGLPQRTVLSLVFLAAAALPLAAFGVLLGFAGDTVLGLLDSMSAKMGFAVLLYTSLGVLALGYALSQAGIFHLPSLTQRISGPGMPDKDRPYRRAVVLGSTMGAGMGMGCPMPTYYVLLGWVAAAANPVYGAIVLGVYGLGRVLPAVGIGALIVGGVERRAVSRGMTSFREKTEGVTNGLVAATGSYLIVLFGIILAYRWATL